LPQWVLSLHAGATVPHGSLETQFDPALAVGADLEFRLTSLLSLEAYVGHDRFKAISAGVDDFELTHASGHAKLTFSRDPLRLVVLGGAGAYWPKNASAQFGWNVGGGLQYWLRPKIGIEALYNYRRVDASAGDIEYSTITAGVRWRP
jgi:opacity protein-like surface antigen